MKRSVIAMVVSIYVLVAAGIGAQQSQVLTDRNIIAAETPVALSPLEKQGDVSKALTDTVNDLVKTDLMNYNNVKVLPLGSDRKVLLRELELHQSGLVDDKYKIDPGKFLGATKIIQGKISRLLKAYYITLHVLDVKTGTYVLSRKVTVCSEQDIPARTHDLVKAVAMGLGGVFHDPDQGYGACMSQEQTQGLSSFKDIGKTPSLQEISVRFIQASSVMYEPGFDHNPWTMIDNVIETAWADGNQKKSGAGEWLLFSFDAGKTIDEIAIVNGLGLVTGKWGNLYTANAAVKAAELLYSNGMKETVTFKKTHQVQRVTLKNAANIHWMKFTITDEYPGTKFQDTCISEIKFFGR